MRGKFEQRRWNYWVVLLFLIFETAYLISVISFTGVMILISRQPDGVGLSPAIIWSTFDLGLKFYMIDILETVVIAAAVSILLLMRRRIAFKVYLINVVLFVIFSIIKTANLGTDLIMMETKEVMFGIIFGSMQVGLVTWALWAVCSQKTPSIGQAG